MSRLQRAWYAGCQVLAQVLFITGFGIRVYGRRRLPERGGALVVSNHQSFLDPILAAVGMRRVFEPMARESLFRVAPFRWLIRSLYAFPVRRATADMQAIREALRRLKAGRVVLMFPEGTRTRDGSIGRMFAGPVTLAQRAGVPLVPLVIDGAFEAWPRWQPLPLPHKVRVAVGRPIAPEVLAGSDPEAAMEAVRGEMRRLQAALRRLRDRAADPGAGLVGAEEEGVA